MDLEAKTSDVKVPWRVCWGPEPMLWRGHQLKAIL